MSDSTLLYDLPTVTVRRTVVSDMANNVYLITHKGHGAQILIDAADDAPAIQRLLLDASYDADVSPRLRLIATTHSHWDHIRALAEITVQTGVPTAVGREDAASIKEETGVGVDRLVDHGDVLDADGLILTAVHLRGHTPGSTAYILEAGPSTLIFSGDSLFPGGVGNTGGDHARFISLLNDVQERLFDVYPLDSVVLPGHGEATTLGSERPELSLWRERGW